jgi:predicted transcriptional regulator
MEIVWHRGERISVHDVHRKVPDLAYTTVMTTLDRLYKKGILARHKAGRAFLYSARLTSDELRQSMARRVLGRLLGSAGDSPRPVLSGLVDTIESDGALDELERLVRERRERLRREGR